MKRFTIPCDFGGQKAPFHVYIGKPVPGHPLKYQAAWLRAERGGQIPDDVMESFQKLYDIAKENNVSFEELCVYALSNAQDTASTPKDSPSVVEDTSLATKDVEIENENNLDQKDIETLNREEIVMLMQGKNENGERVFCYLRLSVLQLRALKNQIIRKQDFQPPDFGVVLASGYGYPSVELRAEMAAKYSLTTLKKLTE
jgi:hypothetical protein